MKANNTLRVSIQEKISLEKRFFFLIQKSLDWRDRINKLVNEVIISLTKDFGCRLNCSTFCSRHLITNSMKKTSIKRVIKIGKKLRNLIRQKMFLLEVV
jgi:hypothetical protein